MDYINVIKCDIKEIKKELNEITSIGAPSYKEKERADYILYILKDMGYKNAFIDKVGNVIVQVKTENSDITDNIAFGAHIDTVFPELQHNVTECCDLNGKKIIKAPGIGDDTANVVLLLKNLEYFKKNGKKPICNLTFIFDVCEEGLGNLAGMKEIFVNKGNKYNITKFYAIDLGYDKIRNKTVGSRRYEIKINAEGGHSYGDFGNKSAIEIAARIISRIYNMDFSELNKSGKTTYNVGVVNGGTSVNAIADHAVLLAEIRSDRMDYLELADNMLKNIIKDFDVFNIDNLSQDKIKNKGYKISVKSIGQRPVAYSGNEKFDNEISQMTDYVKQIIIKHSGNIPEIESASTDCNIPASIGIPSICFGGYIGGNTHTYDEWIYEDSLETGFKIINEIIGKYYI